MSSLKVSLSLVLVGAALLMAGCASFDGLNSKIVPPTLIEKATLPQPPPAFDSRDFYIKMEILVGKDGAVRHVTLTRSTGDEKWDSAAVQRIMMWKFSPATLDDKPIQMRIIQTARVVSAQPEIMDISEIVCATSAHADSAYALLKSGAAFDSIAAIFRSSVPILTSGHIGEVDIHCYTGEVQDELQTLKRGDFTHPLPLGSFYAIFKRN
jgi:TonB family protein